MSDQEVAKTEGETGDSGETEAKQAEESVVEDAVSEQATDNVSEDASEYTTEDAAGEEEHVKETDIEETDAQSPREVPDDDDHLQQAGDEHQDETEQAADQEQQDTQPEESGLDAQDDLTPTPSVSMKYEPDTSSALSVEPDEAFESHPLDELTDQQVIEVVQEIETENRHLQLENVLFGQFLRENDPSLLDGLDEIMHFLTSDKESEISIARDMSRHSSTMFKTRYRLDSYTSITSIAEGKGPKINLSHKTDMVIKAMEESQASLEIFTKKCHIIKRNLKSELEEFGIREAEMKEAMEIFEFNVVIQGVDKLTQRIPAEKFIRYMEEWLKSAQFQIEKLRLRIATLKVQYKKVSQQLIQRQELGENVHAVDFDQLEIENKHFIDKIDQKNIHLLELKKMNGGANLILSIHKKFLQKQQEDCNRLKEDIESKNKQVAVIEEECSQAEEELSAEMEKFENCKNLKNKYTVPEVMEYVRLKGQLYDLRKNIKIWVRRRKIQEIALNTCLREMKNLTGMTDVDQSWFLDTPSSSEESVN